MNEEHEVEKLLKRYSELRRSAGGESPVRMPGPTRHRLYDEINAVSGDCSSTFERKAEFGFSALLRLLIPLAAVAIVVVVCYQAMFPDAEHSVTSGQAAGAIGTHTPQVALTPEVVVKAAPALPVLESAEKSPAVKLYSAQSAPPEPVPKTPPSASPPVVDDPILPDAALGTVSFSREGEGPLTQFDMEREDRKIFLMDADGSRFEGLTAVRADGSEAPETSGVGFVASGYSETLKKEIRMSGVFRRDNSKLKVIVRIEAEDPATQRPMVFEAAQTE